MAQLTSTDRIQRIRDGYEAFGRGDLDAIRDQFNPDIKWHIGGKSSFAGDYVGIDAVFEFFGRIFTETGGTLKNELHDVLASDDHTVVLLTQTADRNGKHLNMDSVQVVHPDSEGRVLESWFLPNDSYATDDFWS